MAGEIPTIPIPTGDTSALPTPYGQAPGPEAFGAGLGRGLMQLGEAVDKHAQEADVLAAQEAESTYAQTILQRVHGSVDKTTGEIKPGFVNLEGHEALSASGPLSSDLSQAREDLASTLANDRQRRIFLARTQGDLLGANRAIEGHVSQQIAYLRKQDFDTRMEAATQTAVAQYDDPVAREEQLANMGPWLDLAAEQHGLTGADAERFKAAERGKIVMAVLQRLLEEPGHTQDAKTWLEAHRTDVEEKDAFRFRAQLRAGDIRDQANAQADQIWAAADGDPAKAMDAVRQIKDGELRDAVDQRIGRRLTEDHAVKVASDAPREGRLEQSLFQGQGIDRLSADYQALSDEGKARIDAKAFAYQRSLRAEGSADRRAQSEADRAALAWFGALPVNGANGRDQVSLDIDHAPELQDASPTARDIARKQQRVAGDITQRGLAPNLSEFRSLVATQGRSVLRSKEGQAQFSAYMQDWWEQQVSATGGRLPDRAAVNAKMADALLYGDEKGGSIWASDQYKFQAERKGVPFVPFKAEEQKYSANRPGVPAPPGPAPQPSAPRPAKLYRRVDPATGEARVWNGSAWVQEAAR